MQGLRQPGGKASSSTLPAARARSALDEAVEALVAAASSGPKEAVAATKQVQSLAMAQLRAAKQLADSSPSERERVEPEVRNVCLFVCFFFQELKRWLRAHRRSKSWSELFVCSRAMDWMSSWLKRRGWRDSCRSLFSLCVCACF